MRSTRWALWMILAALLVGHNTISAQKPAQKTAATPATAAPAAPRLSNTTIAALQELADKGPSSSYLGLSDGTGKSARITVRSSRVLIAFNTAKAKEGNGRYAPPEDVRADVVLVKCGNTDLGNVFECAQVAVKDASGRVVKPVSYSAGPETIRNAAGTTWAVRLVQASYLVRDVVDGFSVEYDGFTGPGRTLKATGPDVDTRLLFHVGTGRERRKMPSEIAADKAEQEANERARAEKERLSQYKWVVAAQDPGVYHAIGCPALKGKGQVSMLSQTEIDKQGLKPHADCVK
jgi:hypothetical protein